MGRKPLKSSFYTFNAYLEWRRANSLSDDPDEWIDECLNGNNRTLVKHVQTLLDWAGGPALDGKSDNSRERYYYTLRGFYKKNFVSLPSAQLRIARDAAQVTTDVTAHEFLSMLRTVLDAGHLSIRDRSVMFTMLQGGMDDSTLASSFNFVAFPQLVKHFGSPVPSEWDVDRAPVRIDLVRPKTDYRYYTFLHTDALAELKLYLSIRGVPHPRPSPRLGNATLSEAIYLDRDGNPLTARAVSVIYNTAGKKAGVNVRPEGTFDHHTGPSIRYPFHGHEVRDTLVTLSRGAGVPEAVANFFIGHDIDPHKYDKSPWDDPEHFKTQYGKLGRLLNLVSGQAELAREEQKRADEGRMDRYEGVLRQMVEKMNRGEKVDPALLDGLSLP